MFYKIYLKFGVLCLLFLSVSAYGSSTLRTKFDFDGDGKADISVFRPSDGFWYISKSSGGYSFLQWGKSRDTPVPGDYDGDDKTDLAVYRPGDFISSTAAYGYWHILRSSDNTFRSIQSERFGGFTNYLPVPADYDGDGKTDLAVYDEQDYFPAPAMQFL